VVAEKQQKQTWAAGYSSMHLLSLDSGRADIKLFMLRLDEIHPTINGNKYFKLKYNLVEAREKGFDTLLTFGGAFSNHIAATATAGKENKFKTIGIIRGEESSSENPTLVQAKRNGMQLHFVSREEYRNKDTAAFTDELINKFGKFYLLPEGGSNKLAVKGCAEIPSLINIDFDYITCAVGTGGTLAGISCNLEPHQKAIGFSALKGGNFLNDDVAKLIFEHKGKIQNNFTIETDFHFGGYAKVTDELRKFKSETELKYNFELDYVYTSKMLYGVMQLIEQNYFKSPSVIIAVHTGGQQGNAGFEK
jgi:1-aminocyclopropane-1-carboxylate deaminase